MRVYSCDRTIFPVNIVTIHQYSIVHVSVTTFRLKALAPHLSHAYQLFVSCHLCWNLWIVFLLLKRTLR
jgi:hypothetical protein